MARWYLLQHQLFPIPCFPSLQFKAKQPFCLGMYEWILDIIKTEMYFSRDILIVTRLKPSNCWGKSWIGSNRFPDNQALEKWAQGLEMYKSNWLLISNYDSCCSEMAKCSSVTESINWSQRQSACCQTVKAKQGCCLGICGSDRPAATQLFLVAAASFPKKKSQTSVTL